MPKNDILKVLNRAITDKSFLKQLSMDFDKTVKKLKVRLTAEEKRRLKKAFTQRGRVQMIADIKPNAIIFLNCELIDR